MKNHFAFPVVVFFVALSLLIGCNRGPVKPAGSPPIFPCTVTVVNGGTPIQGAVISFIYAEHPTAATTGFTDARGIAEMRSVFGSFVGAGAPLGKAKVTVTKQPVVHDTTTQEARDNMSESEARAHGEQMARALAAAPREVPESLGNPATSTIEFEIQNSGNDFTIDVSQFR